MSPVHTIKVLAAAVAAMAITAASPARTQDRFTLYDEIKDIDFVLAKFKEHYKQSTGRDVEINYFTQPGEEMILTLQLEARSGDVKADVVTTRHEALKELQTKFHIFEAPLQIENRDAPEILERMRDPIGDGSAVPTVLTCYVIGYNTNLVKPEEVPKRWTDLLDARWKNQVGLGDPEVTGGGLGTLWFLTQYLADRGSPYGWDFYERLAKNTPQLAASHNPLMEMVSRGELSAAIIGIRQVIFAAQAGEPVAAVLPEEGCAVQMQSTAVVADSENKEAARAYASWIISKEGVEALVEDQFALPSRTDVANPQLPFAFELDPARLVPLDSDWVAGQREDYLARFREAMKR
jgi:iron(III) transport system substrate-binding protein